MKLLSLTHGRRFAAMLPMDMLAVRWPKEGNQRSQGRSRTDQRRKIPIAHSYLIGPNSQERFKCWNIDTCLCESTRTLGSRGKVQVGKRCCQYGNRKEAFFDIFKLEQYVASGKYSSGLFLWLTNQPRYVKPTRGASADFSTHNGRTYQSGTPLKADRARSKSMPLPLVHRGNYVFNWRQVLPGGEWYSLEVRVT